MGIRMPSENQINRAIETALEEIDITPAMFRQAESRYQAIGDFLDSHTGGNAISIYGSIATGTIIRPYNNDDDSYFDFDILCEQSNLEKGHCTPNDVREPIENALLGSERYRNMTQVCDECLTVEYVFNGKEGGFRLDLSPCVKNKGSEPEIIECETYPLYSSHTISIATRNPDSWLGSNPQGFIDWFNSENERFAITSGDSLLKSIVAKDSYYASVEEVPKVFERSALQRAIQLVKRSRDVFYYALRKNQKKPSSTLLSILVINAAKPLSDNAGITEIIKAFTTMVSKAENGDKTIIGTWGAWELDNPVYGGNIFPDDWSDQDAKAFFKWTEALSKDLNDINQTAAKREAAIRHLFGKGRPVTAALALFPSSNHVAPSVITEGHKPFGET